MRWLKMDDEYLASVDFVAFDTETTGLWAPANRVVELGAIKFRLGETKTSRFQALINPERQIPVETIRIHGITDSMVRGAETFKPVMQDFVEFCGPDSVLIAHNAMFDISFVGCESDRVGLPLIENLVLDTVDIYRKYRPGLDSYSLLALTRAFGINTSQNHRAADDAALVWKLFVKVAQDFPFLKSHSELRGHFACYYMSQWQGKMEQLPDRFDAINVAIKEKRRLEIVYTSEGRPPQTRIIRPRQVHFLKTNFYITAFCELVEDERTFRLDRIKSFQLID